MVGTNAMAKGKVYGSLSHSNARTIAFGSELENKLLFLLQCNLLQMDNCE